MAAGTPVAVTAATSVGLVLVLAGAAKLRDSRGLEPFLRALGAGPRVGGAARMVVPPFEVLVGVWLVVGVAPVAAAAAGCALTAGFAAALLVASVRGVAEPCRCFGALDRAQSRRVSLARALLVLTGATAALAGAVAGSTVAGAWPARALGVALAVCVVVAFALLGEVAAFRAGVRQQLTGGQAR